MKFKMIFLEYIWIRHTFVSGRLNICICYPYCITVCVYNYYVIAYHHDHHCGRGYLIRKWWENDGKSQQPSTTATNTGVNFKNVCCLNWITFITKLNINVSALHITLLLPLITIPCVLFRLGRYPRNLMCQFLALI